MPKPVPPGIAGRAFCLASSTRVCFRANRELHAEESDNSGNARAGVCCAAAPASRRVLRSLECAKRKGMQDELLRAQDVLRSFQKRHRASPPIPFAK